VSEWNARVPCPTPAPPDECLSEQDFTTTTTTTPTTTSLYDYYNYYVDETGINDVYDQYGQSIGPPFTGTRQSSITFYSDY